MMLESLTSTMKNLKQIKPLILCLSNTVTMDFVANCLLALGAAPIMSQSEDELEDLIAISHAVNLNIGTLDTAYSQRAHRAAVLAAQYAKPMVLDPVGVGASKIRKQLAHVLLPFCDTVRGNASEILALSGLTHHSLGVESTDTLNRAIIAAEKIKKDYDCTVVISGETDFILDRQQQMTLSYGCALMSQITGMGCALTAVIAAFRAIQTQSFDAATLATAYFGLCGSIAATKTDKPGSFRTHFIDALYACDLATMLHYMQERA